MLNTSMSIRCGSRKSTNKKEHENLHLMQPKYLEFVVSFFFVLVTATCTSATTSSTIILGDNRGANAFDFFMLLFDFLGIRLGVRVQPRLAVLQCVHDFFLFVVVHFLAQAFVLARAFRCGAHGVDITIESVLRVDAFLDLFVLVSKLLCLLNHLFD